MEQLPDWLRLQRIIFSRWVNQKLQRRGVAVNDVVTEAGDGLVLVKLIEELSEKTFPGRALKPETTRVKKIDNLNNALNFVWASGVQMKNKPQAENFVDGDQQGVLGLIWSIMLTFLRIGDPDDDQQLNFKDALLLWAQNKTAGYPGVKVENWKSFRDGVALCALIHKHRPQIIGDWDSLDRDNALQIAFDAAEKYFQLEQYLKPEDVPKLDENSMVVYVSEYYYGIAEQRKLDLAAKRIGKVIRLTEENDEMRAEYSSKARQLRDHIENVRHVLEDRTIDNTMAGARRRLDEFYQYKTNDKSVIIGTQLDIEGIYNNLAMRLVQNRRPEFVPAEGLTLKDISADIAHLEECEQERKIALHAELNRQLRLLEQDKQHKGRSQEFFGWVDQKKAYLDEEPVIDSVGAAQFQIKLLDAFDIEAQEVNELTLRALKELGDELVSEKYERSGEVRTRVEQAENGYQGLLAQSQQKRPELEAALQREIEKERLRLEWAKLAGQFQRWTSNQRVNVAGSHFGFTLEEVESYQSTLDESEASIRSDAAARQEACESVWQQMQALGVKENVYSSLTPDDLAQVRSDLDQALDARSDAYKQELARQRANDALCKEFAGLAEPLSKWISDQKDQITNSKEDLESQLSYVEQRIASLDSDGAQLEAIRECQQRIDDAGITNNRHTTLLAKDVDAQWEQYANFLRKKQSMLQTEIHNQRMKGLSEAELAEIEENFTQFDAENKGALTKKQLKACLYSLGEERTRSQIDEIVVQRGADDAMPHDNFKAFMVDLLGVSDTKDDILYSFDIINRGAGVAKPDRCELVMTPHDLEYFQRTAPAVDGGYDYKAWTDDVFSR